MEKIGYSLVDEGATEIQYWGDTDHETAAPPNPIFLPNGDHVHCPAVGSEYSGFRLVPRMLQYGSPPSITFNGSEVVVTRAPPDPVSTPPTLIATAFGVTVANGDVTEIKGAFNVAAALYLGVGQYMLLFLNPLPDGYFVTIHGDVAAMEVVEHEPDYVTVEARNAVGGSPTEAARFDVQIYTIT